MAIELFGFRVGRVSTDSIDKKAEQVPSFAPPPNFDGAMEIAPGGAYGTYVDMEGTAKNEAELVTRYREMVLYPEVDSAIDDIINEAIIYGDKADPVSINLDETQLSPALKKRIQEEFDNVLSLLDFSNTAYDIFRRWYVDGRVFYHIMVDTKSPRSGISELRYIDPRRIRKIRQPMRRTPIVGQNSRLIVPAYEEYYLFNLQGLTTGTMTQGVKIAKDSICYIHSGILDSKNRMVLSHLHKAVKTLNQLRMLEDATVIYRLARAPERRVFYIDVGNLPKAKAEQYLHDMMVKHKNRLVYDADTGEVKDNRKFMTMLEDYWLPRREGGRGTEITTLPGGENLGQMDDVEYFRKKLYKSLSVPVSRLEPEGQFSFGRVGEITRDEIKFAKLISRLRMRFSHLFDNLLEIQLALTGVMSRDEWRDIKNDVAYDFNQDNHYKELKEQEVLNQRLATLGVVDAYNGKYFSSEWIRKNILRQTDQDIEEIDEQIAIEQEQIQQAQVQQAQQMGQDPQQQQDPTQQNDQQPSNNTTNRIPQKEAIELVTEEFEPTKRLTSSDRALIKNMTKVIEQVSREDITNIEEEIKDDI